MTRVEFFVRCRPIGTFHSLFIYAALDRSVRPILTTKRLPVGIQQPFRRDRCNIIDLGVENIALTVKHSATANEFITRMLYKDICTN